MGAGEEQVNELIKEAEEAIGAGDQLAQASVADFKLRTSSRKHPFLPPPFPQNPPQHSQTPPPPPTTTGGRREPPLCAVEPPHQEEHFNQSGILKILLKDLVEKVPPILHFIAFLR